MHPASERHVRTLVALSVALTLGVMSFPRYACAVPATPEISEKQAQAASAQAELERMRAELEVRVEEYNALTEAVAETEADIVVTRDELERATAELERARGVLADRAANIYKHGGIDALDVFLGARSFEDLITRVELLRRVSAADAATVESVQAAKARVEVAQRTLEHRRAEQRALQHQAEARADEIGAEVSRQQDYVERLDAEVQRLIADEEERQRELAAERARAAAAAAAAAARHTADPAGSDARGGVPWTPPAGGVPSGSVVDIALYYLGVPYVWGGASPSGFDCSGFVQYVYKQVGVSLPRTSQSQFRIGEHIPPERTDLLEPGDLVFFGTGGDPSRVHHVGIYIGGGEYVHAPYTGTVVRVNSLTSRIQNSGDYVGGSHI